jgi:hypothetical protein
MSIDPKWLVVTMVAIIRVKRMIVVGPQGKEKGIGMDGIDKG